MHTNFDNYGKRATVATYSAGAGIPRQDATCAGSDPIGRIPTDRAAWCASDATPPEFGTAEGAPCW